MAKSRKIILKEPPRTPSQTQAGTGKYHTAAHMAWGEVVELNKSLGAISVKTTRGFTVKNIQLISDEFPVEEYGSIKYPPIGASVVLVYPDMDLKNAMVFPAPLNYRNQTVVDNFLTPELDISNIPGGWKTEYNQENGSITISQGDLSLVITIDPEGSNTISLTDWYGNTVQMIDGEIQIQGADDYAVAFNDLKTGYDQLKTDLNNLITAFNSHVHPTAATGPPSIPTPVPSLIPAPSSTASIDGSKVENVRLP